MFFRSILISLKFPTLLAPSLSKTSQSATFNRNCYRWVSLEVPSRNIELNFTSVHMLHSTQYLSLLSVEAPFLLSTCSRARGENIQKIFLSKICLPFFCCLKNFTDWNNTARNDVDSLSFLSFSFSLHKGKHFVVFLLRFVFIEIYYYCIHNLSSFIATLSKGARFPKKSTTTSSSSQSRILI